MAASRLDLVLTDARGATRATIATLTWPAHLELEARAFLRDNLLAERMGDARRAQALLEAGVLSAADRPRFLAEKPFFPPEVPEALAREIDLDDLVAAFSEGLRALRAAPPHLELRFEFGD